MRLPALIGLFVLFLVVVVTAAYLAVPWLAGVAARAYLAERGFPDAELKVREVGLTQLTIEGIDLGIKDGASARRIVVEYSPGRLTQGIIDGITVTRPTLPMRLTPGGVDFGPLQPLLPAGDDAGGPTIRVLGPIAVETGTLILSTPLGAVSAVVAGTLLLTDGLGTTLDAALALTHPAATMKGRLNGVADPSGQSRLSLTIEDSKSTARVAFSQMSGTLQLGGKLPSDLDGSGALTLKDVRVDGIDVGNVDLAGTITDSAAKIELGVGGGVTGLTAQVRLALDNLLDAASPMRIDGSFATDGLQGPARLVRDADVIGALDFALAGRRADFQSAAAAFSGAERADAQPIAGWLLAENLSATMSNPNFAITANGRIDVRIEADRWMVTPTDDLALTVAAPFGGAEHRIDGAVTADGEAPMLSGGLGPAMPMTVNMRLRGALDGSPPFSGAVSGTLWPDTAGGPMIEDARLRLDPLSLALPGLEVALEKAEMRLAGTAGDYAADLTAEVALSTTDGTAVTVEGGHVAIETRLDIRDRVVRAYPPGCMNLRASRIRNGALAVRPGPLSVCPPADGTPMLRAELTENGLRQIDLSAVLGSAEVEIAGAPVGPMVGALPRADATAAYDARNGTWWAKLRTGGGALRLESHAISAADLVAGINLQGLGGTLLGADVHVERVSLADLHRPARFAPITGGGMGKLEGGALSFDGTLQAPADLDAKVTARHDLNSGTGKLNVRVDDWTLSLDDAQPELVMPILRGVIANSTGSAKGHADVAWSRKGLTSGAELTVTDIAFAAEAAEFAGLTGTLTLSNLLQPKSRGAQTLALGLVDPGVPLIGGTLTYDLPGDGTVHIARIVWPFAGGQISADDIVIPFDQSPASLTVDALKIDAAALSKMVDLDAFEANGTLTGSIPLRFDASGPVIEGARIRALGNGKLRYSAEGAAETLRQSGTSGEILAKALENFQFTDLQLTLDGPLTGEITARAEIKGANPDLYNGKKIELNVNLQGVLRDLLRSATVLDDLPDTIRGRVQGPSGKP